MLIYAILWSILLFSVADVAVSADPPNPLPAIYPNNASMLYNATLFVIPVPKTYAQSLVGGYPLLNASAFPDLFPGGFPADQHPLLVQLGRASDTHLDGLAIQHLMLAQITVPLVDRLRDGKSPFGNLLVVYTAELLPSEVVQLLLGYGGQPALFTPVDAGFDESGDPDSLILSYRIRQGIDLSIGPGPTAETVDSVFTALPDGVVPTYPLSTYQALADLPIFGHASVCGQFVGYYDYAFVQPFFVSGNVTLYETSAYGKTQGFYNVPGVHVTFPDVFNLDPPTPCQNFYPMAS